MRYGTGSSQIILKQVTSGLSSTKDCLFAKPYLKARYRVLSILTACLYNVWHISYSGCQKVCGLEHNKMHHGHTERDGEEKGITPDKRRCNKDSKTRLTGQVFIEEIPNLFIRAKHKVFRDFMLCGPYCPHSKSNHFDDAVSHHS